MENRRVLVVNTHGIGDVIMTLPMLLLLKEIGFDLSMLVKSRVEGAAIEYLTKQYISHVNFLYVDDYRGRGLRGKLKFLHDIRASLPYVVLPTFSANKRLYNALAYLSGAKLRVGFGGALSFLNTNNIGNFIGQHKVEKNLSVVYQAFPELTKNIEISKFHQLPEFLSKKGNSELITSDLSVPLICLAPGSGIVESHKRWPIELYKELAVQLLHMGMRVAIIGGPGEESLGKFIAEGVSSPGNFQDMTGKLSIAGTLEFLHFSQCAVTNCNGISHMAAAVQTPVVGLYGPTDPGLTGPYSQRLRIVSRNLDCSPCYRRGYIQGCGNPVCMTEITVGEVLNNLKLILEECI